MTKKMKLGATGPEVFPLALGCMGMGARSMYGDSDETESIATIHAALDAGITLLDTGDYYGMGHNELLLREALAGRPRDAFFLSVKFGALRDVKGNWIGADGRPAAVKNFLAYTLQRLGTDHVDVYRLTRVDSEVPIEDTVGAIAEMVKAVHPICDLQIEYSLVSRGIEDEILPTARELGIAVTAYGVLSRGLLSGHWTKERAVTPGDIRGNLPRFGGANLEPNLALVEALRALAGEKETTVAALATAWVLSRGEDIVPLVGARRRDRLAESLRALDVRLSANDVARIEAAVPKGAAAGDRYPTPLMAHLDSERRSG
jgi:aryl-alcohol dehydrogenase-like predicted oxidoreductase